MCNSGIFEEIASIKVGDCSKPNTTMMALAAFKSLETPKGDILIREWKV